MTRGELDQRKSFFDAHAAGWDEMLARDGRLHMLAMVAEWFGVREGESVLDVGTGTGALLPFLGRAVGPGGTLVAMDFSLNMLVQAIPHRPETAVLINAGVAAIPLRAESFDKVTCFSAFPHFPDKQKALLEMARVLKNGGTVSIAHLHSVEEIAKLHGTVGGPVHRDRLPDREAMELLMEGAGLTGNEIVNEPGRYLARGTKGCR